MRCKTCRYSLENLTEHRCPECGTSFDPNDPSTFNPHPPAIAPRIVRLAVLGGCTYLALVLLWSATYIVFNVMRGAPGMVFPISSWLPRTLVLLLAFWPFIFLGACMLKFKLLRA